MDDDDKTIVEQYDESQDSAATIKRIVGLYCQIIGVDPEDVFKDKQILIVTPQMRKYFPYNRLSSTEVAFHIQEGKAKENISASGEVESTGGSMLVSGAALEEVLGKKVENTFENLPVRADVGARLFNALTGLNQEHSFRSKATDKFTNKEDGARTVWIEKQFLDEVEQKLRDIVTKQKATDNPIKTSVVFASAVQKLIQEAKNTSLHHIKIQCENPLSFPLVRMHHFPSEDVRRLVLDALNAPESKLQVYSSDAQSISVETPSSIAERDAALDTLQKQLIAPDPHIKALDRLRPRRARAPLFNANNPHVLEDVQDSHAHEPNGPQSVAELAENEARLRELIRKIDNDPHGGRGHGGRRGS